MSKFRHHTYFRGKTHFVPYICIACRKSFKRPHGIELKRCPQCSGEMVRLSRKFKPPKNSDVEAWRVVEYVVNAGFSYESIHIENGQQARYPKTIKEAEEFVRLYGDLVRQPHPN